MLLIDRHLGSKNSSAEKQIIQAFIERARARGWRPRPPEGLVVPYFKSEFNRCVEHRELNRIVAARASRGGSHGWFQITPVCRLNDMRKVDSGWYSTVFEMLVSVESFPVEMLPKTRMQLTEDIIAFLATGVGLDVTRLRVTYFGGGVVIPGLSLNPDTAWCEEWRRAGILEENLVPVQGPKNFVLFVGEGERCGPKCEILYSFEGAEGLRWIEVGTLILDTSRFRSAGPPGIWALRPARTIVAGAAYGLERLIVAQTGALDLGQTATSNDLVRIVAERVGQDRAAAQLLRGDALILVDQVRAGVFLLAAGVLPGRSAHGKSMMVILRRIRRKLAILCIDNWAELISELEEKLLDI